MKYTLLQLQKASPFHSASAAEWCGLTVLAVMSPNCMSAAVLRPDTPLYPTPVHSPT